MHSMHTREKVSIAPHHCLASCGSPHATHTTTHSLVGCMMGLGVPPPHFGLLWQASWCTTRPVEPHLSGVGNVEACGASTPADKGLVMDIRESFCEHGEPHPHQLDPTSCMHSPLTHCASLCASAGSSHRHMCTSNGSPAHSSLRCVSAT